MLTNKQQVAYDFLMKKRSVFISGAGGCGKTYLIKHFVENNKNKLNIGITSTTGTSALLIGGTTIFSYLGILLGEGTVDQLVTMIRKRRHKLKTWKELDVLIIDEISMMKPELFDKLEGVARILRRNNKPFGGIQILASGDFCQLPCVKSDNYCFEAEQWNNVIQEIVNLDENKRQNNMEFQNMLNEIRFGKVTDKTKEMLNSRKGAVINNEYGIEPTKLYSRNIDVSNTNEIELSKLENIYTYDMKIKLHKHFEKFDHNKYTNMDLKLKLAIDCQVILLTNLDIERGLVNGSRGVVIEFKEGYPVVQFMNGVVEIIKPGVSVINEEEIPIAELTQIPLKLGYAISIHKSQGMTIDCAILDLGNVFASGQTYVALSRIKTLEGLSLVKINYDKIYTDQRVIQFYNYH